MTAVTVIEAGPCPVVQVKTADVDGYDAIQLAFEEVAERKLSKPEVGHLRRPASGRTALVEFRGESRFGRRDRDRRGVRAGRGDEGLGPRIGKGYQGTIKRHGFTRGPVSHGSHNVRKPGSIGASAYPSRVFKGMKMSGRMGGTRVTSRARRPRGGRRAQPPPRPRLRSRSEERARGDRERVMAAPKAPVIGGSSKEVALEDGLRRRAHAAPRARDRSRGDERRARGTKGTKSRGLVAGGRSKPWRQKGTGRARAGTTRAPHWTGGGVAFAPGMRSFEVKVNRKARRTALRGVLSTTRRTGRSRSSTAPGSTPLDEEGGRARLRLGRAPALIVLAEDEELS